MQYADDICWVGGNCSHAIDTIKSNIPPRLLQRDLHINLAKTEEYIINREKIEWERCKYLGSILLTENDIARRNQLATAAFNNLNKILTNNKLSLNIKIRKAIYICHRNILRKILLIRWPEKISNEDLYKRTIQKPWSHTIRIRRVRWLGHLLRLPEEAPARKALDIYFHYLVKHPRGAKKISWVDTVNKDLKSYANITIEEGRELAQDRKEWRSIVARMIGNTS